jgi:beta-lactamase regulating signal transducer with metallopeptidase domain
MNMRGLESIFTLTWHSSLRTCVLIVAVLALQGLAGKRLPARFHYALSLLVLLRLIVLVTPASGWSVFNVTRHVWRAPATGPIPSPVLASQTTTAPLATQPPANGNRRSRLSLVRMAAGFWLCGVVGGVLGVFWRHRKFARWVAQLPAANDPRLIELVEECKGHARVRRAFSIASAPRGNSAAVFGFFRPCLLLPEGLLDHLERREARLVLLHELLHIRRRDVLVNWISVLALALHWFNPLAWVAMRRLRADQELACDAAVLSLLAPAQRGAYGRTLLKLMHDFPAAPLAAGLVPLITSRNNIKRRIIMITEFKRTGRPARAWLAALLVALGGLTFTHAADDPKPALANASPPPFAAPDVAPYRETASPAPTAKTGVDYGAEYIKQSTLLAQLKAMDKDNHSRFIQALSVTASDPILNSLLEQELTQETRADSASQSPAQKAEEDYRKDHLIMELKEKIDQRANGIMAGMSLQVEALKAAANDGIRRAPALGNDPSRMLEEWVHQRVLVKSDYLEYSNLLFNLSALPAHDLPGALTTAYSHQMDPALVSLADRLQTAKAKMVEVEHDYGRENPQYKTAKQQLENAQAAYQGMIDGVMAGIRTRVNQDKGLLQLIQIEEDQIKAHQFTSTEGLKY